MSSALTLAEIIRRNVLVEWHEGVALVRAVVEHLLAQHTSSPDIPELHDIELSEDGRVEILGGTSAAEPVRRLGQLLQATLGQSEPPVQLRLVISQATASTSAFGSIREFDEVLGYYERPNRDVVLQGLFQRADAVPPIAETKSTSVPMLDVIAPLPTEQPTRAPKRRWSPAEKRRIRRAAVAAVLLLGLIAAGIQYLRVSNTAQREAEVAALAAKASDVVGSAVVTGLSAVTETVGLGRLVEPTAPAGAPPPAPIESVATPTPSASGKGNLPAKRLEPPSPLPVPTLPVAAFDLDPRPGESPADGPSRPTSNGASAGTDLPTDPDIFSPSSRDVVPPVGVRPQLPRELPPNVRREDLARIELIVAADGSVETVKLASLPRNVHDSMWLSAIKAWQFQPAMKDGLPVRYLKTVWIASR